ncbi:aldehyde dehydrogenase family protein [uncultured Jatrophihabitans sp.]|uniref:aldehyde dehydrogenase family protein n=1 Tax=uncultured Jatrophihabitans sp. TaxID=1610747 RepID=UPI0035CC400D
MLTMTIDGKAAETVAAFDVVNPATGEVADTAPECTADQLDAAMTSAQRAQREWRTDAAARSSAMLALAEAITTHADELSTLLQLETGKPTGVAAVEPGICAAWLQYYASLELSREVLQDDDTALIELVHRPHGVVAAITPWNFPIALGMWKIAPALRAGNAVVIKPSPFTPLAVLRLGQIMGDVLPPGVVNTVTGGDELGAAMVAHPVPRKVSFTGSIAGGKKVALSAAADLKRVTLELGGNDAAIILDDADVASTVARLLPAAFFNSGQACALPKRIFAPANRYEEFVDAFAAAANGMQVGDPIAETTHLGPLSTKPQFERVGELVDEAIAGGARVAAGGHRVDRAGYFFEPTVLADIADSARIVEEEQFGLALPILRYDSVDEAVRRANDTEYGLCGSVWSSDADRATTVVEQLEVGTAYVNTHAVLPPNVQFGGAKASGLGVENGVPGLLSFTEAQVVHRARV